MKLSKGSAVAITLLLSAIALTAKLPPQTMQQAFSRLSANELGESKHYQVVAGSVHDGDSLRVSDGQREIKVVLCGIDAPEIDQSLGIQSHDRLQELIAQGDGRIILVPTGTDKHRRTIADAFIPIGGEEEINLNSQRMSEKYQLRQAASPSLGSSRAESWLLKF